MKKYYIPIAVSVIFVSFLGIIYSQFFVKPRSDTLRSAKPTPTPAKPTPAIQTYRNDQYGFEFDYLNNYEIYSVNSSISPSVFHIINLYNTDTSTASSISFYKNLNGISFIKSIPLPNSQFKLSQYEINDDTNTLGGAKPIWVIKRPSGYLVFESNSEAELNYLLDLIISFEFTTQPQAVSCKSDSQCPSTHFCDFSLPGAMGPNGYVIGEPSGSQVCVQKCKSDSDCPQTQACQPFSIMGGDIVVTRQGCK